MYIEKRSLRRAPQDYNGLRWDSDKEAGEAKHLDKLLKRGKIVDYHRQERLNFYIATGGQVFINPDIDEIKLLDMTYFDSYIIDFVVKYLDDPDQYIEVKGIQFPDWKRKWRILEACFKNQEDKELILIT